jgi:hypothetical protein
LSVLVGTICVMAAPVVDEVQAAGDARWLARLRAAETESRMAQARVLEIIGEHDAVGVAWRSGYGTVARMFAAVALIGAGEARNRVAAAEALAPRQSLTGETLPPRCPVTAAAFAAGEISAAAVRIVTDAMRRIPAGVHPEIEAEVEQTLADHARRFEPRPLAQITHRVLAHLDPDGPAPTEAPPPPARELHLRPNGDGSLRLDGHLDNEGAAIVRTVLDSLSARRPDTDPAGPDQRTLAQRNGDALVEACGILLDDAVLPTAGGQRPHLVVTIGLQQLIDGLGSATLDYGGSIDAATARRLACDSCVVPVVLGGDSQPLDVGQAKRSATAAIRAGLAARDGGCAWPGCDQPPGRCIAHHICHFAHHGETKLSNLVLLCRWHHHLIHHSEWKVRIREHIPEFIPPEWLDPDRTPLRNPLRQ